MPVITFDNGQVVASRVVVCRTCTAKINLSLTTEGRPEQDVREHILVTMDRALTGVAGTLGWTNVDELNRADCPRHGVAMLQCDFRDSHDETTDTPAGNRCPAQATHRIYWEDGRYSLGCDDHLEIDDKATVKPVRVVRLIPITRDQLDRALHCTVEEWSAGEGTLFDLWCRHVGIGPNTYEGKIAYAAFKAARNYFLAEGA